MSTSLEIVSPTESVEKAAGRMRAFGIGSLLVGDDSGVRGVLTDRDILVRVTAQGIDARMTSVVEVMSPGIVSCSEDADVEDIAELMKQNGVQRVALFDKEGHPTGIVSLGDFARNGFESTAAQILITKFCSIPGKA